VKDSSERKLVVLGIEIKLRSALSKPDVRMTPAPVMRPFAFAV